MCSPLNTEFSRCHENCAAVKLQLRPSLASIVVRISVIAQTSLPGCFFGKFDYTAWADEKKVLKVESSDDSHRPIPFGGQLFYISAAGRGLNVELVVDPLQTKAFRAASGYESGVGRGFWSVCFCVDEWDWQSIAVKSLSHLFEGCEARTETSRSVCSWIWKAHRITERSGRATDMLMDPSCQTTTLGLALDAAKNLT